MANQTIPGLQWLSKQIEQLDADLLRQMLKAITEFLMGLEADQRCGAEFGKKSLDKDGNPGSSVGQYNRMATCPSSSGRVFSSTLAQRPKLSPTRLATSVFRAAPRLFQFNLPRGEWGWQVRFESIVPGKDGVICQAIVCSLNDDDILKSGHPGAGGCVIKKMTEIFHFVIPALDLIQDRHDGLK